MDLGLAGHRAFISASTSGLGLAVARALHAEGARVIINGRDPDKTAAVAASMGSDVGHVAGDVSKPESAAMVVRDAMDLAEGLDVLVTNGPGPAKGAALAGVVSDYRAAVECNLLSVVAMVQEVIPPMIESGRGRVVAISSLSVRQPLPNMALSNTARPGLAGFLKTLSAEVAPHGITVNSVLPGFHATERLTHVGSAGMEDLQRQIPVGQPGDPADLGAIVAFLCSRQAGFVTGSSVLVDGGSHAGIS